MARRKLISPKEKTRAQALFALFQETYPEVRCTLDFRSPLQLLIMTILAAQCTDARVNIVTQSLFSAYPSLESLAAASPEDIEAIVKPCGLGKSKARDIYGAANMLLREYGGVVPKDMDALLRLPGVGRKSANLIRGDIYGLPAVVADTHCIRIANRMGFVSGTDDPLKVERALVKVLPPEESADFCHRCVLHGRAVCTARTAHCTQCMLADICRTGVKLAK